MDREVIAGKVRGILKTVLGSQDEELTGQASLIDDLGMKSLDDMDIILRLESEFGIKLPRGNPFFSQFDLLISNKQFVADGRFTPAGLAELQRLSPSFDQTKLGQYAISWDVFDRFLTPDYLVELVARNLESVTV